MAGGKYKVVVGSNGSIYWCRNDKRISLKLKDIFEVRTLDDRFKGTFGGTLDLE